MAENEIECGIYNNFSGGKLGKLVADSICYSFENGNEGSNYHYLNEFSRNKSIELEELELDEAKELKKECGKVLKSLDNLQVGIIEENRFQPIKTVIASEPLYYGYLPSSAGMRGPVTKKACKEVKGYIEWLIESCEEIINEN